MSETSAMRFFCYSLVRLLSPKSKFTYDDYNLNPLPGRAGVSSEIKQIQNKSIKNSLNQVKLPVLFLKEPGKVGKC